jgi:hypothetical protein
VDATRAKRWVVAAAAVLVTAASLLLPLFPTFWPVAISQGIAHAAAAIFSPAVAAVSLGVVGHRAFTRRIGRNESFNHAGNARPVRLLPSSYHSTTSSGRQAPCPSRVNLRT